MTVMLDKALSWHDVALVSQGDHLVLSTASLKTVAVPMASTQVLALWLTRWSIALPRESFPAVSFSVTPAASAHCLAVTRYAQSLPHK